MKSDKMIEPLVENEHVECHHPKDIEASGGLPQPGDMSRFVSNHKTPISTLPQINTLIYVLILLMFVGFPLWIIVNVLLPYMVNNIDFSNQISDLSVFGQNNDGLDTKFIYYSTQRFVLPQAEALTAPRVQLVHDFNSNLTGVVDRLNERCFIKPLDRNVVKPPHSLFDLWQKMWQNVYKVDQNDFRDLFISFPRVDILNISPVIAEECGNWPVFRLVKNEEPMKPPMYEEN